jgi:YgiT-type zinc finger domain-containing protein
MSGTDCYWCKGDLEETLVSRVQKYHDRWYLIENVPALVCSQCGETYYTPDAHDMILSLLQEQNDPVRVEPLNVLDAGNLAS